MPCFSPLSGWRQPSGSVVLGARGESQATESIRIPCGRCVGCRLRRARDWCIRCGLELSVHDRACWATLTYDEKFVPVTLSRSHLSGFLKRLRSRVSPLRFRFFGCGEYGERYGRPHYHVILFGLSQFDHSQVISESWPLGFVRVDPISPRSIAYVCGYTVKKAAALREDKEERLDVATGELYRYQPPFLQMSRNPGIAGYHRGTYWRSWRDSAIVDGRKVPVPAYLHKAWLACASDADVQALHLERESWRQQSVQELLAGAADAVTRLEHSSSRRKQL